MVITVVCGVPGKESNGTTIAAMNLIRALCERGHAVRFVCSDPERAGTSRCPLRSAHRRSGMPQRTAYRCVFPFFVLCADDPYKRCGRISLPRRRPARS